MVRKYISLVLLLAVLQLSAFAAECDLNCLLTHARQHHPVAAAPQSHHEHHSGHMHSAHMHSAKAADAVDSFKAVPQCHQGVTSTCSNDCASKTSANRNAISSARHVFLCTIATREKAVMTYSPLEQARQLFLPPGAKCRSAVLRI